MTSVIVTSAPSTKKLFWVVVIVVKFPAAPFPKVTFSMYAIIVDLGVQERFPIPSVSNTYPIAPPVILTLETSPKLMTPPAFPPRFTQSVPLNASTWSAAIVIGLILMFPITPLI